MKNEALLVGLAVCLAAGPVMALDVNNRDFYPCQAGDCRNGQGKVFDVVQGQWLEGPWQGGQTVPGQVYWVSHPLTQGKRYEQIYGSDGLLAKGSMIRGLGAMGTAPVFTGTFGRVDHAFMRARLAVPQEGVYDMGNGIEFRGRFEYLPAKGTEAGRFTMGYFIFFGERIDTEDNTTETGLFVSDTAVPGGAVIRLQRARADYMALLQEQYQRDLQIAAADFKRQDGEKVWRMALSVLGEVALTMAGSKLQMPGGNSAGNRFAMELVKDLMTDSGQAQAGASSGDPSARLLQMVSKVALGKVTGNKDLADKLSDAVAAGIDKANAASK